MKKKLKEKIDSYIIESYKNNNKSESIKLLDEISSTQLQRNELNSKLIEQFKIKFKK